MLEGVNDVQSGLCKIHDAKNREIYGYTKRRKTKAEKAERKGTPCILESLVWCFTICLSTIFAKKEIKKVLAYKYCQHLFILEKLIER